MAEERGEGFALHSNVDDDQLSDSLAKLIVGSQVSKRAIPGDDGNDSDVDDFIASCRRDLSGRYPLDEQDSAEIGSLGSELDDFEVVLPESADQQRTGNEQQSLEEYTSLIGNVNSADHHFNHELSSDTHTTLSAAAVDAWQHKDGSMQGFAVSMSRPGGLRRISLESVEEEDKVTQRSDGDGSFWQRSNTTWEESKSLEQPTISSSMAKHSSKIECDDDSRLSTADLQLDLSSLTKDEEKPDVTEGGQGLTADDLVEESSQLQSAWKRQMQSSPRVLVHDGSAREEGVTSHQTIFITSTEGDNYSSARVEDTSINRTSSRSTANHLQQEHMTSTERNPSSPRNVLIADRSMSPIDMSRLSQSSARVTSTTASPHARSSSPLPATGSGIASTQDLTALLHNGAFSPHSGVTSPDSGLTSSHNGMTLRTSQMTSQLPGDSVMSPRLISLLASPRLNDSRRSDQLAVGLHSLSQLDEDLSEVSDKKEVAVRELHHIQEKIARLKAEFRSAESLTKKQQEEASQAGDELLVLTQKRNVLQESVKSLRQELEHLQNRSTEKLPFSLEDIQQELLEVRAERDSLKEHLASVNTETKSQQRKYEHVHQQLDNVQEELFATKQQSKDTIHQLRMELEETNRRVKEAHQDKMLAVADGKDEMKSLMKKDMDMLRAKMAQERAADIQRVKERSSKQVEDIQHSFQAKEREVQLLSSQLQGREEAAAALSVQVHQFKKLAEQAEQRQREAVEDERQRLEKTFRREKASAISKLQESLLAAKQREMHELNERYQQEKAAAISRHERKQAAHIEDLHKQIKAKEEELKTARNLLTEQEEATRTLGETLRLQARTQIKTAVEKERKTCEKEFERERRRQIEQHKEELQRMVTKTKEEAEKLKHRNTQLQASMNFLKQELEEQKQANRQLHREKLVAVREAKEQTREENKQEVTKVKQRLEQEHAAEKAQLERHLSRDFEVKLLKAIKTKDDELRETQRVLIRQQQQEQQSLHTKMQDDVSLEVERRVREISRKSQVQQRSEIQKYLREIEQLNKEVRLLQMNGRGGYLGTSHRGMSKAHSFSAGLNLSAPTSTSSFQSHPLRRSLSSSSPLNKVSSESAAEEVKSLRAHSTPKTKESCDESEKLSEALQLVRKLQLRNKHLKAENEELQRRSSSDQIDGSVTSSQHSSSPSTHTLEQKLHRAVQLLKSKSDDVKELQSKMKHLSKHQLLLERQLAIFHETEENLY